MEEFNTPQFLEKLYSLELKKNDNEEEIKNLLGSHVYDTFNKITKVSKDNLKTNSSKINIFPNNLIDPLKNSKEGDNFKLTVILGPKKDSYNIMNKGGNFSPLVYNGNWIVKSVHKHKAYGYVYTLVLEDVLKIYLNICLSYDICGYISQNINYLHMLSVNLDFYDQVYILEGDIEISRDTILTYFYSHFSVPEIEEYKEKLNEICDKLRKNIDILEDYISEIGGPNYYTWVDAIENSILEKKSFDSFKEKF